MYYRHFANVLLYRDNNELHWKFCEETCTVHFLWMDAIGRLHGILRFGPPADKFLKRKYDVSEYARFRLFLEDVVSGEVYEGYARFEIEDFSRNILTKKKVYLKCTERQCEDVWMHTVSLLNIVMKYAIGDENTKIQSVL